jgi:hypothetical protein
MHLPFHMSVGFTFESAMIHCDNLIKLERRAGGGRGKALMWEVSANRAVIVLAIASWQAFVQDTVHLHPRPSYAPVGTPPGSAS